MEGIIYCYNLGNKKYVGKTLMQPRKRMDKHKYEAFTKNTDTPFARAIRKYGWEATKAGYSVIETVSSDSKQELQALLMKRETHWIETLDTLVPNGYNVYSKGQELLPHTKDKDEIYRKVSKSLKGKYMNAEATSRPVYCIE